MLLTNGTERTSIKMILALKLFINIEEGRLLGHPGMDAMGFS